jgi:hypothetical protein
MAKMKIGRTTSQTTPPDNYKKYQSDSTNYEEQSKFYKNYNFDIKSFGNQARFGTPKKAKPSTVKTYNESYRSKGEPAAKDIYLSQYGSDEMFIENYKNNESHGYPGIAYEKPIKPKQVIDPSKTKKSVTAKVTPKETIAKTTVVTKPKEDMTLSKMPIKKAGLIKTEKKELQGELEKRPEYTQISSTRKNILPTKGGRYNIHTPIGAKVVQALTGYNKKGGYQEGEGRIFGDRIRTTDKDRSYNTMQTDESGRAIFKGAEGLKDLRAQKKYNKEFDKYQAKQDQMNAYSSMMNNPANRNTIDSQISKLKK